MAVQGCAPDGEVHSDAVPMLTAAAVAGRASSWHPELQAAKTGWWLVHLSEPVVWFGAFFLEAYPPILFSSLPSDSVGYLTSSMALPLCLQ